MAFSFAQVKAMLDLYKVVPAEVNRASRKETGYDFATAAAQLERGVLFIDKNYNAVPVDNMLLEMAEGLYGIDAAALNATFYTNPDRVVNMSRWELFVDQCIHYAGTYGRASEGLKPLTFIPVQELNIPGVDVSKIKVTVIRLVSKEEIVSLVNDTLLNTKTPSRRIVDAVKELLPFFNGPVNEIRSFELAVMAFDYAGLVPLDGKAFLRYLIYKTTGSTTIINNRRTAVAIEAAAPTMGNTAEVLFAKANFVTLSAIFLRYKNLFLAFKKHDGCAPYINRLRRMADTYHRPLSDASVQNYIQMAIQCRSGELFQLRKRMDNREMVKVINAMLARLAINDPVPGVFNIRNGRAYCKSDAFYPLPVGEFDCVAREVDALLMMLCDRLKPTLAGKTFYIPEYVNYAVPTSEKQYIGNFPWGTSFTGPNTLCDPSVSTTVGIQWVNPNEDEWVDLDLHCFTADGHHFGWNADYYQGGACVYSGDMTNAPAPKGAAEAFWIRGINQPIIFTANKYRGPKEMPFKLALSTEKFTPRSHYVMDPNELVFAPVPMKFQDNTNLTLGVLVDGEFLLYSGNLSEGAVPNGDFQKYIQGIVFQQQNKMLMQNLLVQCNANVITTEMHHRALIKQGIEVIDLSPEMLTASTLMDIVDGKLA